MLEVRARARYCHLLTGKISGSFTPKTDREKCFTSGSVCAKLVQLVHKKGGTGAVLWNHNEASETRYVHTSHVLKWFLLTLDPYILSVLCASF